MIAAGKESLKACADRSVTIAYASPNNGGSLFFSGADSQEATIVRQLGLNWLPGFDDNSAQSLETLNRLNETDIVLSYDFLGSLEILEGTELFATVEPVKAGRFVLLSGPTARALFAPSTLSVRYATEELVQAIITAAEGNGTSVSG